MSRKGQLAHSKDPHPPWAILLLPIPMQEEGSPADKTPRPSYTPCPFGKTTVKRRCHASDMRVHNPGASGSQVQGVCIGLGGDRASCRSTVSDQGGLTCPTTRLNSLTVQFEGRADYRQPPDLTRPHQSAGEQGTPSSGVRASGRVDHLCRVPSAGVSLTERKKKVFRFPKKARGHSMCSTMVGGSWRLAVGGGWRLAVGSWQLAVGGGWWWLAAVGGWRLVVGGSWQWLAVGGWPPLAVGSGWWLAVGGGWWLAVGGGWQLMGVGGWRLVVPWGCS